MYAYLDLSVDFIGTSITPDLEFLIKLAALVISFLMFRRAMKKDQDEKLASKADRTFVERIDKESKDEDEKILKLIKENEERNLREHREIEMRNEKQHIEIKESYLIQVKSVNDKLQLLIDLGKIKSGSTSRTATRKRKP